MKINKENENDANEYIAWKNELNKKLSKFEDIEKFLLDVDFLIEYYLWKYKDTFSSKEKLTNYLRLEIPLYVKSFEMSRKEKSIIIDRLIYLEINFDKIINFWEFNPVEQHRKSESLKLQPKVQEAVKTSSSKVLDIILFRKK